MNDDQLGQLYRAAITHLPSGQADAAKARATALRRLRNHRIAAAAGGLLVIAVVVLALVPRVVGAGETIAATPATTLAPEPRSLMTAEPDTASPGSVITLGFPDERIRGVAFTLESVQPTGWKVEYYLIAGRGSKEPGANSWFRPGDPSGGWPDVGIRGPGGEKVRIPKHTAPGTYRLCTVNPPEQICTTLTVT